MKYQPQDKRALLQAALGRIPSDLAITNVQYVNVFTGEVYPATVFVHQGFVAHVEAGNPAADLHLAQTVYDGQGRTLGPGFIDAHGHVESSMLTPRNFAAAVLPHGTTTAITDPHEIANVAGEEAVHYMHDAALGLPMRQLINIPSCVPSVPGLENAGATFDADTIRRLAQLENVHGLAEVMDFIGVVEGEERMLDIIAAAEENGLYLQGHLPRQTGRMVSAYRVGGPWTCHESTTSEESVDKMRAGMYVDARDSSISRNVTAVWEGVGEFPCLDRLTFCTDDREADDILYVGHIDDVVRHAVSLGMDPVLAIRSATLLPAQAARLDNLGAVAPGYVADFLLLDNLRDLTVKEVFTAGRRVAADGALLVDIPQKAHPFEAVNSMDLPALQLADFGLKAPAGCGDRVAVNVMTYGDMEVSTADAVVETLPVKDGLVDISGDPDLCYAIVINRYGKGTWAQGIVRGFGLERGADGSTVSHDCHNLTIVYRTPADGFAVFAKLRECGGGIACAAAGEVLCTFPLPVGGLMSNLPWEQVAAQSVAMKKALRQVGLQQKNPLLRIATLALPVIPKVKISDLGLVDVLKKERMPLFPEV